MMIKIMIMTIVMMSMMIMIITMVMMTMIMMNRMMIRLLEAKTGQRQDFDISHEQNDRDLAKIHIVHADNMFMQNLSPLGRLTAEVSAPCSRPIVVRNLACDPFLAPFPSKSGRHMQT